MALTTLLTERIYVGASVRLTYDVYESRTKVRTTRLPAAGTDVPFRIKNPSGVTSDFTGKSAGDGVIYCDLTGTDIDEAGRWEVQAQILGTFTTIDRFPVFEPL